MNDPWMTFVPWPIQRAPTRQQTRPSKVRPHTIPIVLRAYAAARTYADPWRWQVLKEASVAELAKKDIARERRVLVNRRRGNDELAPSDALYRDFESRRSQLEENLGKGSAEAHNIAFLECDYERRFRKQVTADAAALAKLEQLARRSEREDVYLVCYEGITKACHRRILLRIAAEEFGAQVAVEGLEPKMTRPVRS
jgi:hypothetical protein